jgi:hypothetical protein
VSDILAEVHQEGTTVMGATPEQPNPLNIMAAVSLLRTSITYGDTARRHIAYQWPWISRKKLKGLLDQRDSLLETLRMIEPTVIQLGDYAVNQQGWCEECIAKRDRARD